MDGRQGRQDGVVFGEWLDEQGHGVAQVCRRFARSGYPMSFIADWLERQTGRRWSLGALYDAFADRPRERGRVGYAEAWWREHESARQWLAALIRRGATLTDLEREIRRRHPEGSLAKLTLARVLCRLDVGWRPRSRGRRSVTCSAG